MRVVFFGTPAFALPALHVLATDPRFDLRLVVSQPDRPRGRGRRPEPPPVGATARELGVPLYQPESLRTPEARQPLAEAAADLFVVAAFGLIFGEATLRLPRLGAINLHASLLPAYRGASPVAAAILAGDETTGVTLMKMERGLDTGPIVASVPEPIYPFDTTEELTDRLAIAGARLLPEVLAAYAAGMIAPVPQPAQATLTRPLTKADGWIDWTKPALEIERLVRAMWPWPRTWTTLDGTRLQILRAAVVPAAVGEPGAARLADDRLVVACGAGGLALESVQPANRAALTGRAFAARLRGSSVRLGSAGGPGPQPPLVVALG